MINLFKNLFLVAITFICFDKVYAPEYKDGACINPDQIASFGEWSETETRVNLTDGNFIVVQKPFEDVKKILSK